MEQNFKIKVTKNGPYFVSGGVPIQEESIEEDADGYSKEWKLEGKLKPASKDYLLCRCGHSKNMPFCDQSHLNVKFDGTEKPEIKFEECAETLAGPNVDLRDCYDLCASARFCDRAGTIWDLVEKDDPESTKIAIEEAQNCSSGRLVIIDKKTGEPIEKKLEPCISATVDLPAGVLGPLWVKGGIKIESADGKAYEKRNRVTLCRCGKSKNMPFCDSSHMEEAVHDHEHDE